MCHGCQILSIIFSFMLNHMVAAFFNCKLLRVSWKYLSLLNTIYLLPFLLTYEYRLKITIMVSHMPDSYKFMRAKYTGENRICNFIFLFFFTYLRSASTLNFQSFASLSFSFHYLDTKNYKKKKGAEGSLLKKKEKEQNNN